MIFDALIIGGGPAGSSTAILLAKAGWSTAIVEKKLFPRRKVCGEFISATSLPLMHELGIADFYTENAGPEIHRVGLFAANKMLTSPMPHSFNAFGKWGRALGREHLDTLLMNEAKNRGAAIWQPWEARSIQNNNTHFICKLQSKEKSAEIKSRIIILAQGSWEKNLTQTKIVKHQPSDLLAFKAHFRHSTLDSDLMPLLAFPGGYGGLVHTDHNRVSLSCCIRRDVLQSIRKKYPRLGAGDAVLKHITSHCVGVHRALLHSNREGQWLSVGPIRPGIRKCYASGVFFVGNIAGEAHPIVAEGISMALQSGWLLANTLIKHQQNLHSAGKEYALKWKAQFANRIFAASVYAQSAMRPQIISLLLPFFEKFPQMITYGAKLSGKIMPLTFS